MIMSMRFDRFAEIIMEFIEKYPDNWDISVEEDKVRVIKTLYYDNGIINGCIDVYIDIIPNFSDGSICYEPYFGGFTSEEVKKMLNEFRDYMAISNDVYDEEAGDGDLKNVEKELSKKYGIDLVMLWLIETAYNDYTNTGLGEFLWELSDYLEQKTGMRVNY